MSRYCTTHARIYYRTRDPNGRMFHRAELGPWRDYAEFGLEHYRFGGHPAVQAAERKLEALIANPSDMAPKYAEHFQRLHAAGVDGRKMLVRIMAVYGIRYLGNPGTLNHDDAVFWANLGSYFLRSASVGRKAPCWYSEKKGEPIRLPGADCEAIGYALAQKIGGLCLLLWKRIEEERARREAEEREIAEALERHPL